MLAQYSYTHLKGNSQNQHLSSIHKISYKRSDVRGSYNWDYHRGPFLPVPPHCTITVRRRLSTAAAVEHARRHSIYIYGTDEDAKQTTDTLYNE